LADISMARSQLGYVPRIGIQAGLRTTVEAMRVRG
jgi:nucleoside-diphosphate-sugar epimerase